MLNKIFRMVLILHLGVLSVACSRSVEPGSATRPEIGGSIPVVYQVTPTTAMNQAMINQNFEIRNCGNTNDKIQMLEERAQVAVTITIADRATPKKGGSELELTPKIRAALEENIRITYQGEYEAEIARVAQTKILVPGGKIYIFNIYWKHRSFSATIDFTLDDVTYSVPYTYRLELPYVSKVMETGCTG